LKELIAFKVREEFRGKKESGRIFWEVHIVQMENPGKKGSRKRTGRRKF